MTYCVLDQNFNDFVLNKEIFMLFGTYSCNEWLILQHVNDTLLFCSKKKNYIELLIIMVLFD